MEAIDGLQKHKKLQDLLKKVERRLNEKDSDDASVNMRKILEYITTQYMKEYAQQLSKENLFGTINGLRDASILPEKTINLFHKIRMAGNEGGAHYSEEDGSLKKIQSLYNQLLEFIPTFIDEFPEPSKKKVKDNPLNIDYMSITSLLIELPDYEEKLELDEYFPEEYPDWWYPEGDFTKAIESLYWTQDPERYIYQEDGKTYVDRFQLTIDTVNEIEGMKKYKRLNDPVYIPGIIQEYFGFSSIFLCEEEETIIGPSGRAAKIGKYKTVEKFEDVDSARIIYELSSFSNILVIPDCVTKVSGLDILNTKNGVSQVTEIYIPVNMTANQSFYWLGAFFNLQKIIIDDECDFFLENGVVYTKDKKKLLYATKKASLDFQVPDEVEVIGEYAFYRSKIQSIFLNNVKIIEKNAFWGCINLQTITSVSKLEYMGDGAFRYCEKLDITIFTTKPIEVGAYVFEGCPRPKPKPLNQPVKPQINVQPQTTKPLDKPKPLDETKPLVLRKYPEPQFNVARSEENWIKEGPDNIDDYIEWLIYYCSEESKIGIAAIWIERGSKKFGIKKSELVASVCKKKGIPIPTGTIPSKENEISIIDKYPIPNLKMKRSKEDRAKEGPMVFSEYVKWISYHCNDNSNVGILPFWISVGAEKFGVTEQKFIKAIRGSKNLMPQIQYKYPSPDETDGYNNVEEWHNKGPSDLKDYIEWISYHRPDNSIIGIAPLWICIGAKKFGITEEEFINKICEVKRRPMPKILPSLKPQSLEKYPLADFSGGGSDQFWADKMPDNYSDAIDWLIYYCSDRSEIGVKSIWIKRGCKKFKKPEKEFILAIRNRKQESISQENSYLPPQGKSEKESVFGFLNKLFK